MPKPTIIIDTREQKPWEFPMFRIKRKALKYGDYSVAGYEKQIIIERKSIADLFQSFTKTRSRMVIRLEEMGKFQYSALIVEGDIWDILKGHKRSQVNGRLLFGSVAALCASRGVAFILAGDRLGAQTAAQHLIEGFIRLNGTKKLSNDATLQKRKDSALQS